MNSKFEALQRLQNFVFLIEKQYAAIVKIIRSNNSPEFAMPSFYASKGLSTNRVVLKLHGKMEEWSVSIDISLVLLE